jgi:hypothetical protein
MQSLPMVVAGGIAFGITETVLLANVTSGTVELYLFLVLLALLIVRGGSGADGGPSAAITTLRQPPPPRSGSSTDPGGILNPGALFDPA